jgi:1-acyl-sn-glycerol-3-phosphate acyltransferase
VRDVIYPPIVVAAKTGFRLLGNRFRMTGTEHVPTSGGVLLAYNHIGYVDFVYGGLAAQPSKRLVRFMGKKELFDHRVTGPVMRGCHHIEVDRGAGLRSMEVAKENLLAGEAVGIFPEATISRSFEIKEIKTGAVRIAAAAGVPLVPVILWGTHRLMTKDHPKDFSRGTTISISVGTPLHPTGADPVAETAELRAVMAGMLDEAIADYPAAEQPPGSWWLPRRHGGTAPTLEEAEALDIAEKRERAARRAQRST